MGQDVAYSNNKGAKAHENTNQVHYEACGQKQKYTKNDHSKQSEEKHHTKYVAACATRPGTQAATQVATRSCPSSERPRSIWGCTWSEPPQSSSKACVSIKVEPRKACKSSKTESSRCSKRSVDPCGPKKVQCASEPCITEKPQCSPQELTLAQRLARCYEIKRAHRRDPCNRLPCWQHGKYVRDICGSGIVSKGYLFGPTRKLWCKTPLSMYQATIGELARKILCREIVCPRDVKGEPPSNIAEYIMPPCRGYYRKYDCLRPCEEEFATVRNGKKVYRDRVERHWEPCLMKDQKHQLDINDYAPHNAYLSLKLQRRNITDDELCW